MLERFTHAARQAVEDARADADTLRTRLPRGTRESDDPLAGDALASLGIDLDAVRRATDAAFGRGALDRVTVPGRRRLRFADDAKQTLAGGVRLAAHQGHRQITSGHLLFGILDQTGNGALTVLTQAGADVEALRADVLRRIGAAA
jgi:ATP-dependent Clp protease ATP-binding subunit ClpA